MIHRISSGRLKVGHHVGEEVLHTTLVVTRDVWAMRCVRVALSVIRFIDAQPDCGEFCHRTYVDQVLEMRKACTFS